MLVREFMSDAPGTLVRTTGQEWLERRGRMVAEPFDGVAFVPHALPPPDTVRQSALTQLWPEHERAIAALSRLDGIAQTLSNPHLISSPFRIREAQASSRIENTIATAEEVASQAEGIEGRDESREVANYLRALDAGLASEYPINQTLIREMHKRLMTGVRGQDKHPGVYRSSQAYIAGETPGFPHARFVPPPPDRVVECMDSLERSIRGPGPWPGVMAAALTHYQFETIHPFSDGNGRLGRMLISLQLCRSSLLNRPLVYVSSFFDAHRDAYYRLLRSVSTNGDWVPWLAFFLQAVATQADDGVQRADRLLTLRRTFMQRVTEPRAPAKLRETIDLLFERPVVKATIVAQHLNVKTQQAQRYIDKLTDYGILTEITGGSYARVYAAREILAAIERDEHAAP